MPRVRRRAAVAIGRVGLKEGIPALTTLLADPDADVRQSAAFALGLIGDRTASAALLPLLPGSRSAGPRPRRRSAGLDGRRRTRPPAIAKMAAEYWRDRAAVTAMKPDDEPWPAAPEAEAFKLGLFALVRLRAYDPLAAAVLDGGRPVSTWWPVAYALQRIDDPRAAPALRQLLGVQGPLHAGVRGARPRRIKDPAAADVLLPLLDPDHASRARSSRQAIIALAQISALAPAGARLGALAADRCTATATSASRR